MVSPRPRPASPPPRCGVDVIAVSDPGAPRRGSRPGPCGAGVLRAALASQEKRADAIIRVANDEVLSSLRGAWGAVLEVSSALVEQTALSGAELTAIVGG